MTIVGRYGDASHAPYVDAHIMIPRFGLRGSVSFLIDTGADTTVLAEVDAKRLGVKHSKLKTQATSYGIGGPSDNYLEPAVLFLADGPTLHFYRIEVMIVDPKPHLRTMPSLLGRDVINRLSLILNHSGNNCHIEIVSSDGTL
jgi:hypothetical protein